MNVFFELLEVILNCFYNVLFKGNPSFRFLLALSGPAYIVCPLQFSVKDIDVGNWGKLNLNVLYKRHWDILKNKKLI